jgi:predicted nucleic acid-binding protein
VILLDTSVLSLVFRRRSQRVSTSSAVALFRDLVASDAPLAVPGIVLQELLSGVRGQDQFHELQRAMEGFPLLLATELHHVKAAQIVNACRTNGVVCSTVDALIAAMTLESQGRLFTLDKDFQQMASYCGLKLVALPS